MIVAKESAAASCAAGARAAKGLAASSLGTACSDCADRWTVGGMSATDVPKQRAATAARRIMVFEARKSKTNPILAKSAVIDAQQLKTQGSDTGQGL